MKPSHRISRLLAGILVLIAAAVPAMVVSSPAQAAVPVLSVPQNMPLHVLGHKCAVLGGDGIGNQAVACSDLAVRSSGGDIEVWASNQLLCQHGTTTFACQGIWTTAEIAYVANGVNEFGRLTNRCGAFGGGACPAPRFQKASDHVYFPLVGPLASCVEIWAVAIGNQVETRNNVTVVGPNVASIHYQVCPASA